jgi:hypothetical protein
VYPSPQLSSHFHHSLAHTLWLRSRGDWDAVVSSVAARATQLAATRTYTHSSAFASIRELAGWVTIAIYQEACCNLQLQHAAPAGSTNPNQRFDHTLLKAHLSPHQHQLPCYGNRLPPPSTPHSALTSAYNHACKHVHHRSSSTASHPVSCGVRDSRAAHCHAPCCPQLSTVGCRKHAHALHPNQPSRFTETPLGCCCNVYDTRRPTDDGAQT